MSNPLLQPDDRFRRPTISAENNPFGDVAPSEVVQEPIVLPTRPEPGTYVTSYGHRGWTVLGLAIGAFLAVVLSSLAFMGGPPYLAVFSLFAVPPAIFAWRFGADDLRAMEAGVMDQEGEQLTAIGMWLGIVGMVLGLLMLAASIGIVVLLLIQFV